jgi:hypothetical protein
MIYVFSSGFACLTINSVSAMVSPPYKGFFLYRLLYRGVLVRYGYTWLPIGARASKNPCFHRGFGVLLGDFDFVNGSRPDSKFTHKNSYYKSFISN